MPVGGEILGEMESALTILIFLSVPGARLAQGGKQNTVGTWYNRVLWCVGMRGSRLEEAVLVFRMTRIQIPFFSLPLTRVRGSRCFARGLQECTQIPDR